jgi:urease beta subunit
MEGGISVMSEDVKINDGEIQREIIIQEVSSNPMEVDN